MNALPPPAPVTGLVAALQTPLAITPTPERLQALKDTMARMAAGVVVVTAFHEGHDWGMTCSSFTTVSLQPALVLWCLHRGSHSHAAFTQPAAQGGGYSVSVLAPDQADLARRFATGTQAERFAGLPVERLASGRARLPGTIAWFDCALHDCLPAGDHDILIGDVIDFGMPQDAAALVYSRRHFGRFEPIG